MYDLLDRPIAGFAPGIRFVLWATRAWAGAAAARSCPPGALAPAFAHCGAIDALPHFHRLIIELNRRALEDVHVAPLGHATISEWEALILRLWIDAVAAPVNARATLALVVEEEAVESALGALICAANRLVLAGLPVEEPLAG